MLKSPSEEVEKVSGLNLRPPPGCEYVSVYTTELKGQFVYGLDYINGEFRLVGANGSGPPLVK